MTLRVALQMDEITSLNFPTDTSIRMGLEAQRRGYALFYYTPNRMSLLNGRPVACIAPLCLRDDPQDFYTLGAWQRIALEKMDVILLRQDPPFDMTYITTTFLLESLAGRTLVANDPASVRNAPEKIFPTLFAEYAPPTLISADVEEIRRFRDEMGDVVIKPLYGYAGNSVFRLKPGDGNFNALLEHFFAQSREPIIAQRFLPEVKAGDKRVLIVDGEVAGVMARIPAEDEIRANFRVGGTAAKTTLTPRQQDICGALGAELKRRGLLLAGVDLIGDYLIEVNLTSPTGFPAMNRLYGVSMESVFWDAVERRLP